MGLAAGVITACTFSKTIAPGLRAGYTFAEPTVIKQISSVKMGRTYNNHLP
jgi:DNA-binding transcriptional MocR family regulator